MPWPAVLWLLAFITQCSILGMSMYQLVQLTDLEADMINPHEATKNYNMLVMPEYIAQAVVTVVYIIGGNWIALFWQLIILAYSIDQYRQNKHLVDVTEIFREVGPRKKALTIKLVLNLIAFIWAIYRFIEVLILSIITPKGRQAAKAILKEAAASLH